MSRRRENTTQTCLEDGGQSHKSRQRAQSERLAEGPPSLARLPSCGLALLDSASGQEAARGSSCSCLRTDSTLYCCGVQTISSIASLIQSQSPARPIVGVYCNCTSSLAPYTIRYYTPTSGRPKAKTPTSTSRPRLSLSPLSPPSPIPSPSTPLHHRRPVAVRA